MASEVNRVTLVQVLLLERRNCNDLRFQFRERFVESGQIGRAGEDRKIGVTAKLRCAVQHASLTAHQQGSHTVMLDRRKDFAYRVRDQGSPQGIGMSARAFQTPASVRAE